VIRAIRAGVAYANVPFGSVRADGVVALSVERLSGQSAVVAWLTRSLLVGLPGV